MATSTKTESTPTDTDFAQNVREQFVTTVQKGQQVTLDAAKTWAKAVSVLPVAELPTTTGVPSLPAFGSATEYTFDVAAELLKSQRTFALELSKVLAPEKTA